MKLFPKLESINWTGMWWIVGITLAFWSGMAALTVIYPPFDTCYKIVNIILGAVSSAFLFAARGTKYVTNRQEPPADGKP